MRKRKYIAVILITLLGIGSCSDDFLEMEPLTDRVEDNFYKTEKDAFEALVAIYDVLQWQSSNGYHP